jgi:hypothetical protein
MTTGCTATLHSFRIPFFILFGYIQVFITQNGRQCPSGKKSCTRRVRKPSRQLGRQLGHGPLMEQRLPRPCKVSFLSPPALTGEALSNERMMSSIPSSMDMQARRSGLISSEVADSRYEFRLRLEIARWRSGYSKGTVNPWCMMHDDPTAAPRQILEKQAL